MTKIKTLADLKRIRDEVQSKIKLREQGEKPDQLVQIKVAMATCGIASGAKEVMNFMIEELEHQGIDAVVTQTGCMGYCFAEPTIELTVPGKDPVVYGHVTREKAKEIIEKHIKQGELVDGIIPVNYKTIDD